MAEKIRILVCHTDGAVYELPDYSGPPELDDTLNYRLVAHENHVGNLFTVPAENWEKPEHRAEILRKIHETVKPGDGVGLGETFYDVKSNFQGDALKCWGRHNRTHDCGDYMTDKMRLYPDTKQARKEEGLPARRPNTFLCQFCPVHQIVQQRKNSEEYRYNYDG